MFDEANEEDRRTFWYRVNELRIGSSLIQQRISNTRTDFLSLKDPKASASRSMSFVLSSGTYGGTLEP